MYVFLIVMLNDLGHLVLSSLDEYMYFTHYISAYNEVTIPFVLFDIFDTIYSSKIRSVRIRSAQSKVQPRNLLFLPRRDLRNYLTSQPMTCKYLGSKTKTQSPAYVFYFLHSLEYEKPIRLVFND